ncbi:MAG: hypothetical protein ACREBU_08835 [Nitrososphaera sp.]
MDFLKHFKMSIRLFIDIAQITSMSTAAAEEEEQTAIPVST